MPVRLPIFAALAVSVGSLLAQQPQQQRPTFRTSADVVPLSITVVDKSGRPVTDLKASDFTILEDGKPREILNFFTQTFTPEPATVVTGVLNRAAPSSAVTPQTRRTFLIVLGYGRIQYPAKAVDGLLSFVRQRLLPQDLVAVMGFDRATDFTTDHEQIARMLERYRSEHERIIFDYDEFLLRGLAARYFIPIREDIDAVFTGVPTPRVKNPSPAWSPQTNGTIRTSVPMLFGLDRDTIVRPDRGYNLPLTVGDLTELAEQGHESLEKGMIRSSILRAYAGIEYLRYIEGEKHMLYLGETGLVPFAPHHLETDKEDDAKFARRLNDARITLDMVRTAGVAEARFGPPSKDFFAEGVWILGFQQIAELNGGTYTGVTTADKALERVDALSRTSYLVGYAPSNPELDGKYRKVDVKINRKDLIVRYRHGYYAASEPEPLELKELVSSSRLEGAVSSGSGATDIKIDGRAEIMPRLGITQQLRVDLTIDASRLSFGSTSSGRAAEIELRVYVGDDKQNIVGNFTDRLRIRATEEQQAEFVKSGIAHSVRVNLLGTPKHVKVVVYDYGADLVGTVAFVVK